MRTRTKRVKSPPTLDDNTEQTKKTKKSQTYLQVKERLGLYKANLKKGDTKLHVLMRYKITVAEFKAYMEHVGEAKAILLAKTPNDIGKLPIKEVTTDSAGSVVKRAKTIEERVLQLTRADNLLPMDEFLDEKQMLQCYPVSQATIGLRANLWLACHVVNRVRKLGLRSSTMPSYETLTVREQNQISTQLDQVRAKTDTYVSLPMQGRAKPTGFMHYSRLHIGNRLYSAKKVGNCLEYAKHAMEFLREEDKTLRIEAMHIKNGDHVFVVIGRAQGSKASDFTTWGDAAVVCDAWAGRVFPASEIPEQLGDYRNMIYRPHNEKYTVVTGFNPNYHRIDSDYELPAIKR